MHPTTTSPRHAVLLILMFLFSLKAWPQANFCNSLATSVTGTNVTCSGGSNGTATANVTGGNAPFSYSWAPGGQTTPTVSNLSAGTYTVTVIDNSCQPSGTELVNNGNFDLGNSGFSSSYTLCNTANCLYPEGNYAVGSAPAFYHASFTGTGFGGSGNFMIINGVGSPNTSVWCQTITVTPNTNYVFSTWVCSVNPASPAQLQFSINGLPLGAIFSAPATTGTWTQFFTTWNSGANTTASICVVNQNTTASGNDFGLDGISFQECRPCTTSATITITQPAPLTVLIPSSSNVNCFGAATGSANTNVTGGTAPYTYLWSNGAGTANLSNVAAGAYSVMVTDNRGCTATANVNITQPSAALNVTVPSSTNVNCFGTATGSANTNVTGGTAPYTYLWSNGATTANLSNVAAGTYNVTVTDNRGCTRTASVNITQPSAALNVTVPSSTNVNCFGTATGSANTNVTGGTAPYTYLWSNGAGTANLSNVVAGAYSVTVTDNRGCTATASVNITQPSAALNVTVPASINVNCFGAATGSANTNVTGGTAPYTYLWNNGATTANLSNVVAGAYSVTVTDNRGCTATASVNITQPAAALNVTIPASTNVNCFGAATGNANTNVTGGTAPYAYLWNNGASTANITGLTAGNYTVVVTDNNGCTSSSSVSITQPSAVLSVTVPSVTSVDCFGNSSGSANTGVTGGTAPYAYLWSNGASTANITGLISGNYNVTVTDNNGCTSSASVTITQPAAPLGVVISTSTNVNCYAGATGTAGSSVTGGTTPYNYLWNTGATTQNLANISAGTYSVTVTDDNGCTASASIAITQPVAALNVTIPGVVNVDCFGNADGSAGSSVTGGTAPYAYAWNTGATTTAISNLPAGNYNVTVTDNNGCTGSASVVVTQPAAGLSVSISSVTNVSCFGNSTGSASTNVAGGTAPYTYLWSNGATTASITNVPAGAYMVTVSDNAGCTSSASVTITQPSAALSVSIPSGTNVSCFGNATGSAVTSVTGGTAPYTYLWSNGTATANLSNIVSGNYTVTVTDNNGCTSSASVNITQPSAALNIGISSSTNVNCFGNSTGGAITSVSGGTPAYAYLWSNGSSTANLSNVVSGNYTVTVTDNNGCTSSASVVITQPSAALNATVTSGTNVSCFGNATGSANTGVFGGTAPYAYLWSNGSSSANLSNVISGNYSVTVTDGNGCTSTASVVITQPSAALNATIISSANVNCFGDATGSANTSVSGGTAPYIYLWSNGSANANLSNVTSGNYGVTVTDGNGCTSSASVIVTQPSAALNATITSSTNVNCFGDATGSASTGVSGGMAPYAYLWSNGSATANLSNVLSGNYSVTVTDGNGCTSSASVIITQPSAALQVNGTTTNVACFGNATGTADITATGGTAPYSYLWSNGSVTEDISDLGAGNYQVTVTDANGCVNSLYSGLITQPVAALNLTATVSDISCGGTSDGSVDATVSGGTAPYAYQWSHGPVTEDVNNLPPAAYTVQITDANGCTISSGYTITAPPVLTLSGAASPILCYGNTNGSIDITVGGGMNPYQVNWSNGSSAEDLSNLAPGLYTVTVTDGNNCTASQSFSVGNAAQLQLDMDSLYTIFAGDAVTLENIYSGGTGNYTFTWTPDTDLDCPSCPEPSASPLVTTHYTLVITDQNGCEISGTTIVEVLHDIFVPNTFTPNGDGLNDQFSAVSRSVQEYKMMIFDRWGDMIYQTDKIDDGWNGMYAGADAKQDVYVYRIEAKLYNGEFREMLGQVNLLR